jgi:Big-like domain-containing protein/VCBS repeat protein
MWRFGPEPILFQRAAMNTSISRNLLLILLALVFVFAGLPSAQAATSITTTSALTVSSSSITAGTAVTLTATVTGTSPVTVGQVTFCDSTAAHCDGPAVFGVAQVTSSSTATLKLILGVGTYSIKAVYSGAPRAAVVVLSSTSTAQSLTVTGNANYATSTAIASSGSVGNYTLTGTITAFGEIVPTGDINFLDTSYSSATVATATLNSSTLGWTYVQPSGSPLNPQSSATFAAAGDFNNDGIPDIAILNHHTPGTISICLGNGDGTFQTAVNYTVGAYPVMMTVADLNGDGNLDLISVNYQGKSLSVLLGNGDGTFRTQTTASTGNAPEFVAVADLNGDGWLDLVVTNSDDATVGVLLGKGDGTFQSQVTYLVGTNPFGVVVADFNGDGDLDVAATNSVSGSVSILLGNGDGTFQKESEITLPSGAQPGWLATGDLRKNGKFDLVVPDAANFSLYVLLGNGDGTFQTPVTIATEDVLEGVAIADWNADGIPDLIVPIQGGEDSTNAVSVFPGNGDGTFGTNTDYSVGGNPSWAAIADLNGDGLLDMAAVSTDYPYSATILLQQRTESATATGVAVYPAGSHLVDASYPGDTPHSSSVSTTVNLTGTTPNSTATALAVSPNPATTAQTITFTATISPNPTGFSLGTVSFYSGSTLLGTGSVNSSGVATFITTISTAGSFTITAVYSGSAGFLTSTSSPVTLVVRASSLTTATTTTVTASANPVATGASVTFTGSVSPTPTGSQLGTVSFYSGSTLLGTGSLSSSGSATFATSSLADGNYTITAVYSGNTAFATSTSSPLSLADENIYTITAPKTPFSAEPGGTVVVQVMVPPLGGRYDSLVTLSASGLPPGALATFNPPAVTPGASGAPTQMTIQLAVQSGSIPANPGQRFPFAPISMAAAALVFVGKRKHIGKSLAMVLLTISVVGGGLAMTGCNGGFVGKNAHSQTYVITITGTSGNLHPSTSITLVVQ